MRFRGAFLVVAMMVLVIACGDELPGDEEVMVENFDDYGDLNEIWRSSTRGGAVDAAVLEATVKGGYLDGASSMVNIESANEVSTIMNTISYIAAAPEGRQYYGDDDAYSQKFNEMKGNIEEAGMTVTDAIQGLNPTDATDWMIARDRMAKAGFKGKLYEDLSLLEKNMIDELFYDHEEYLDDDEKQWSGPQEEQVSAWLDAALEAADETLAGGWEEGGKYDTALAWAARSGTTEENIISYGKWTLLHREGGYESAMDAIRDEVGDPADWAAARSGFFAFETSAGFSGGGDAAGALGARDFSMKLSTMVDGDQDAFAAVVAALQADDPAMLNDVTLNNKALEDWNKGEIDTTEFYAQMGAAGPDGVAPPQWNWSSSRI